MQVRARPFVLYRVSDKVGRNKLRGDLLLRGLDPGSLLTRVR